jgi:hypothetical protein
MQLIFEKKLPVKVLTTYLELSKEEIHSDIQAYLKKFAANNPQNSTFDTRVQIYLNQIGLLEKQQNNNIYFLSDKGKIAHEKGLVERKEAGTYKIWICQDFLNQTQPEQYKILYFERVEPKNTDKSATILQKNIQLGEEHTILDANQTKICIASAHQQLKFMESESNAKESTITLVWEWNCDNADNNLWGTKYFYQKWAENTPKLVDLSFKYNLSQKLNTQIKNYLPAWNLSWNKCEFVFDSLKDKERADFIRETHSIPSQNNFDSIQAQKVPLMPATLADCQKWRNWLVMEELNKNYISETDFDECLLASNQKEAFKPHQSGLDTPHLSNFLRECVGNSRAFWHLAAPHDLCP